MAIEVIPLSRLQNEVSGVLTKCCDSREAVELIDAVGTRLGIVARPPSAAEVETALARLGDGREGKTTLEVLARLMAPGTTWKHPAARRRRRTLRSRGWPVAVLRAPGLSRFSVMSPYGQI